MLRNATLGRYWQDSSVDGIRSSFTRVRSIGSAKQATPQVYGCSYSKARAFSVPDTTTSSKKLTKLKKSSLELDHPPCMLIESRSKSLVGVDHKEKFDHCYSNTNSENNLSDMEFPLHDEALRTNDGRLLVCTLDTEENERNIEDDCTSLERNRSRNGSVEMVTARNVVSTPGPTQFCQSCGNGLEFTDMVVILDEDTYHIGCFLCGQCRQQVNPAENFLMLEDGSPLCEDCSPVCHSCGERIVSAHVNVLNKDFHEACLKCAICKKASEPPMLC